MKRFSDAGSIPAASTQKNGVLFKRDTVLLYMKKHRCE